VAARGGDDVRTSRRRRSKIKRRRRRMGRRRGRSSRRRRRSRRKMQFSRRGKYHCCERKDVTFGQ
jgi:hypothetical protein